MGTLRWRVNASPLAGCLKLRSFFSFSTPWKMQLDSQWFVGALIVGLKSRWVGGRSAVTGCCRSSWWCLLHPWRWCPSQCRSRPAGPWIPSAWTGRNLEQNGTARGGWPQIKEALIGRTSGDPCYAKFILRITATICHERWTMDERNPFISSFVCLVFFRQWLLKLTVLEVSPMWCHKECLVAPALFCPLEHMEASTKHQQQIMAFNVFLFLSFSCY